MKITIFFTFGISLKIWHKSGLLQREVRVYHELMRRYDDIQFQFLTYGDISDRKFEKYLNGIELIPVYEYMPKFNNKTLNLIQSIFIPWFFRKYLKHTDILKTNQMWGGWVAVISKLFFSKPLIVRCGNEFYDFTLKRGSSKKFLIFSYLVSRFTYSYASRINVATESDKNFVNRVFKIKNKYIDVMPNWVDQKLFNPSNRVRNNKVLFVGRMTDQKNLALLIDSLKGTDIELDVVGEGELCADIKIQIKKNKVNVNFLGIVPNDKMPLLYSMCSVYVLCSRYEGNPKTLLEAMSCACLVIGTDVSGINNIIKHGKNGLLVPNDNAKELSLAIQSLLLPSESYIDMRMEAYNYIKKNNSLNSAVIKEFDLYQSLMINGLNNIKH